MKTYPIDYKGPISGKSLSEEWAAIRDYDAYCWVVDGTWSYSDFDNYLYSKCDDYAKKTHKHISQSFKPFNITGTQAATIYNHNTPCVELYTHQDSSVTIHAVGSTDCIKLDVNAVADLIDALIHIQNTNI